MVKDGIFCGARYLSTDSYVLLFQVEVSLALFFLFDEVGADLLTMNTSSLFTLKSNPFENLGPL